MTKARSSIGLCLNLLLVAVTLSPTRGAEPAPSTDRSVTFFETRIRPILVEHCYECHSQSAQQSKGGLQLDTRQALRRGGDSGPAVVPGHVDQSLLIEAVRYESLEMPPKGKLPQQAIADLAQWIEQGAVDPRDETTASEPTTKSPAEGRDHWAFQPLQRSPLPDVTDAAWPLTDIDFHILKRLERSGLQAAAEADRYTWIRRVSFDLTGLPPTPHEIQAFVNDRSPEAHQRVVDRLLESRAFGQRWARHWLDLVGYADQIGTSNNVFAEHAWRYREYVIQSFNEDKPFDRFIREQLAGDLLPYHSELERSANLTATGFLVLGDVEIVEADKAKLRVDLIDQQIVKTGNAFLGLTIGCARCHDHKFDPIPQHDYYALAGIFNSTDSVFKTDRGVWSDVIAIELPETDAQQQSRLEQAQQHAASLDALKQEREQTLPRKQVLDDAIAGCEASDPQRSSLIAERDQLAERLKQLDREIVHAEFFAPRAPRVYGVRDVARPDDMQITIRGNPRALGAKVARGFLSAIDIDSAEIPTTESGRRELADWIASPQNPLTARVAVNRVWQKLMGVGLVRSVDYFGVRGETPSHPELLDALALNFIEQGWSHKKLLRTLTLSRTYRMSSAHNAKAHAVDPDNRLLWRMHRRRLDAEALRDAILAVDGQLLPSPGGPAIPLEYLENVGGLDPKDVNPPWFKLNKWRPEQARLRTIYLPVIRSGNQPGPAELRNVFDFVQPAQFAGQRAVTAVPTQALFLMNSPFVKEHAELLAERLTTEAPDPAARLERLWLLVLNRPPEIDEREEASQLLDKASPESWVELCHALLTSNEFLMRL